MSVVDECNIEGKVALITADKRGWTPFLAAAIASAGADVAIGGLCEKEITESVTVVESHGRKALAISADITLMTDVNRMIEKTVLTFGGLDILINNARVEFGKSFDRVTESEWNSVIDFNLKSMFLCSQVAGKQMLKQGGGRIVNITSGLAIRGLSNSVVYSATQGAVRQLTASLALEWARNNIRVNAIGAGWITINPELSEEVDERLARFLPSRSIGHPSDLGGLLLYLSSDACDFVTGQTFYVDGGATSHA